MGSRRLSHGPGRPALAHGQADAQGRGSASRGQTRQVVERENTQKRQLNLIGTTGHRPGLGRMKRETLVSLLATAERRLARIEAGIRLLRGAIATPGEVTDLAEASRVLESLQQQRIERLLEVQALQDELAQYPEERE
jgi:hypothetical protein